MFCFFSIRKPHEAVESFCCFVPAKEFNLSVLSSPCYLHRSPSLQVSPPWFASWTLLVRRASRAWPCCSARSWPPSSSACLFTAWPLTAEASCSASWATPSAASSGWRCLEEAPASPWWRESIARRERRRRRQVSKQSNWCVCLSGSLLESPAVYLFFLFFLFFFLWRWPRS